MAARALATSDASGSVVGAHVPNAARARTSSAQQTARRAGSVRDMRGPLDASIVPARTRRQGVFGAAHLAGRRSKNGGYSSGYGLGGGAEISSPAVTNTSMWSASDAMEPPAS
jgi:hypothetical protein